MAYQLKTIKYREKDCHILLQNENGPCPLLAAGNCLLLKGIIALPSDSIKAGIVTIDQLVNVLAETMLFNHQSGHADHHFQEVLTIFPTLQYGMDVNPKFTAGPTGVEYTMHLNAFDLLHIELVHGWLVEPDAQEYDLIGNQTYNQLVNLVIEGQEAARILQNATRSAGPISADHDALSTKATLGSIVQHFLDRTSHQLTQYGLTVLHEYLKDGQVVVFFRNNHFNTLTKHEGLLYLLVTDFGYADVPSVVWEKLDVIDGDTEYVNASFKSSPATTSHPSSAGPSTTNNSQTQADYELALQLSRETGPAARLQPIPGTCTPIRVDSEMEAARYASLEEYNRMHPDNPLPLPPRHRNPPHSTNTNNNNNPNTTRNNGAMGNSYLGAFEQHMNTISGTVRQAGASISEAASAMFPQPAPAVASTGTHTHGTPTRPALAGTHSHSTPTRPAVAGTHNHSIPTRPTGNSNTRMPPRTSGGSLQEAASAMFPQPALAAASTGTHSHGTPTRPMESNHNRIPPRPSTSSPHRPDVRPQPYAIMATGIPTQPPSREDQDRMMALRQQRQEEQQQRSGRRVITFEPFDPHEAMDSLQDTSNATTNNGSSRPLRNPQKSYASRPVPPPQRLVMAPSPSYKTSKDGNCTIS